MPDGTSADNSSAGKSLKWSTFQLYLTSITVITSVVLVTFVSTQRTNALIVIMALIYTLKSSKTAFRFAVVGVLSLLALILNNSSRQKRALHCQ